MSLYMINKIASIAVVCTKLTNAKHFETGFVSSVCMPKAKYLLKVYSG